MSTYPKLKDKYEPSKRVYVASFMVCPFSSLPKILLTHIVRLAVRMLNHFVSKGSKGMTPYAIISGKPPLYYNSLSLKIGSYCMVSDSTSNDIGRRTVPALALLPTDSRGQKF